MNLQHPTQKSGRSPSSIRERGHIRSLMFGVLFPDGAAVKVDLPRWQMSDADLADVFTFLRALPD